MNSLSILIAIFGALELLAGLAGFACLLMARRADDAMTVFPELRFPAGKNIF